MTESPNENVAQAKFNMIEQQIRPWDVFDRQVLEVLAQIPREDFVPAHFRNLAYADTEIPLGHGQSMMAPKIEAKMMQALDIRPADRVLEVGTGSGYLTACLARLARHVVSVDNEAEFTAAASERLRALAIANATLRTVDALLAPVEGRPFDVIAVTGSLEDLQQSEIFRSQLAIGGRLFVVYGSSPAMTALLITRVASDQFREESLFETDLALLTEARLPERFVF